MKALAIVYSCDFTNSYIYIERARYTLTGTELPSTSLYQVYFP